MAQSTMTHILGNRWGQGLQQFHGGVHPGAGLVGVPDVPGHGDGAPVYHATMAVVWSPLRVGSQGQAARPPPAEDPPQQWREAESYVQLGLAGSRAVAAVVEPLPEALAQVYQLLQREGGGHGVLAGAAGEDGPATPAPGRSIVAGRGEVNANRFLHLIAFAGKAHRGSPASGGLTTKMPDGGAPSQAMSQPDFSPYLPLSAPAPQTRSS